MDCKRKVLHVTGTMNRGGAEVMIMDLLENKSNNITYNFLIHYKKNTGKQAGDFDKKIIQKGSSIFHILSPWDGGFYSYYKNFKKTINNNGLPDIIHIHLNAKSGLVAFFAHLIGIKKIIVHSHADIKFRGRFFNILINNIEFYFQKILINKFANNFWAASKEASRSLFPNVNKEEIKIINNAIDTRKFINAQSEREIIRSKFNIPSDTILIGNVGRIVEHKNVLFILDILNELKKTEKSFKFIYMGRIDDKDYKKNIDLKIQDNSLSDQVKYIGLRDDVEKILSAMDLFVSPALREGFGLVAVEAQASNLPCYLYNGYPNSVDMGLGHVKFFDNLDPAFWAKEILNLDTNPVCSSDQILHTISKKGFDIKSNVKTVEKYYYE